MIFIIGGTGRLGKAIASRYSCEETALPSRSVYENWWMPNSVSLISEYFRPWDGSGSVIFVASGLLDPSAAMSDLQRINYSLPVNIIEGTKKLGIRVVTFGTVTERLFPEGNAYVKSKIALSEYIARSAIHDGSAAHIRLHTLYGLYEPSPFMFLGQILRALRSQSKFEMTQGKQLREYHHFEDDAGAIHCFTKSWEPGLIELNHGQSVALRDIAATIFSAFDAENLLAIGSKPEPKEENYGVSFDKPDFLKSVSFRDTLPGILGYMKYCLAGLDTES
ncbi:NAD-dependent epimerase/dehydratase family protein [Rhizobium sp. BR 317]|uniref:NAD-dependent epimerase/dehydratase family protein n=1 Tax=Rhizobium sp. BR 317 TaxID=3040015 RepID=UPI0039BEFC25